MFTKHNLALLAVSAASLALTASGAEALVRGTAACATQPCMSFETTTDPIPVVRGLAFTVPSAGTAQITFHGYMKCRESSDAPGGLDLVSQIVTSATLLPSATGPSALLHACSFPSSVANDTTCYFSLVSTRTVNYPTGGVKRAYFKIGRVTQTEFITCSVFNASISVVFDP